MKKVSEPPQETNLRLSDEGARGVVSRIAEIQPPEPMDNITRADSKVAGVPPVETGGSPQFKLTVDAQVTVVLPDAVWLPTKAAMSNKTARADLDIRLESRIGEEPADVRKRRLRAG